MQLVLASLLIVVHARVVVHGSLLPPKESVHNHTSKRGDVVTSGNYEINSCGAQAPFVVEALHQTHDLLIEAIQSLPAPIGNGSGTAAYNAFFKDVDPAKIKPIYQQIADGSNVTIRGKQYLPTIVCSNEKNRRLAYVWKYCTPRSNEITIGIYLDSSPIILLCPIWSDVPVYSMPHMCGTVNRLGTRLSYPYSMALTKYHTLVHELAHVYIGSPLELGKEVYEVNDCMALPPDESIVNPQSYAYYASCRCFRNQLSLSLVEG
ncbi:hypothetical protein MMC14_010520 [Varicellaria rhodocarpa]|nr:hypothetical protein [Varicellaria rhodocarpa]